MSSFFIRGVTFVNTQHVRYCCLGYALKTPAGALRRQVPAAVTLTGELQAVRRLERVMLSSPARAFPGQTPATPQ